MKQPFNKAIDKIKRNAYNTPVTSTKNKKGNTKMLPKNNKPNNKNGQDITLRTVIIGVLLALVIVSIAYSSMAVWFNISTEGALPKIMLVPQIIVGVGIFCWKFFK